MAGELNLSSLQPAQPREDRKRIGRGLGSGKGRYSGRGIKGQKSRAGSHAMRAGFEGGQMPLYMRTAKLRGNTSKDAMPVGPFRTYTQPVNLRDLEARFEVGEEVTPESLKAKGLIRTIRKDVKLLGVGELTKKLTITVHGASATAREKVESAGGTLTLPQGAEGPQAQELKRRPEGRDEGRAGEAGSRPRPEAGEAASNSCSPGSPMPGGSRSCAVGSCSRRVVLAAYRLRLVDARAGRRLPADQELLQREGRLAARTAEPLLRLGALAVLDLRARDHAVRHGVDHPAADDRRRPVARAAPERRRGGDGAAEDACAAVPGTPLRHGPSDMAVRVSSIRFARSSRM